MRDSVLEAVPYEPYYFTPEQSLSSTPELLARCQNALRQETVSAVVKAVGSR